MEELAYTWLLPPAGVVVVVVLGLGGMPLPASLDVMGVMDRLDCTYVRVVIHPYHQFNHDHMTYVQSIVHHPYVSVCAHVLFLRKEETKKNNGLDRSGSDRPTRRSSEYRCGWGSVVSLAS